ncbi:CACTA en-spm transposon protein [Cucumis melo var. makuwa]|uniref:CACTA en-spm transposon protein n=1 Tax=Cucumis melo var. makuwa TaxID=1194695 RepID=A0A5A7T1A5_CUCMM|nr:CACTA en-spm transposon protein [Cucumis melo var. makuwa]TYK22642.1 CACTA en-spm transposon protein [Cucumis melo var. makuwa]
MLRFSFAEELVILATQAQQVFYLDDPKNGSNWKVIQVVQNKHIWDVLEVDNVKNEQLSLEHYVHANGRISMLIAPSAKKPILPDAIRFNQAIGVCMRKAFPVYWFKWADVGREYIEVVKGDLQRFFLLGFDD